MKRFSVIALSTIAVLGLSACSADSGSSSVESNAPDSSQVSAFVEECGVQPDGFAPAQEGLPEEKADKDVTVTLKTNAGNIPLNLHAEKTPCTTAIIAHLAKSGFYDNTVCHRITTEGIYVLQCGDPTGTGSGGPGFRFADEYPVGETGDNLYKAGTLAMANSGPNTNGSQFFLNYKDSPLPPNYTLFGEVSEEGMTVLQEIGAKGAQNKAPDGPPLDEVVIQSAEVK